MSASSGSTISDNSNASSDSDISVDSIRNTHVSKKRMILLSLCGVTNYVLKYIVKEKCRTSWLSGSQWVAEILNGNETRCFEMFRMRKHVFYKLCDDLLQKYSLQPTKGVDIYEKVGLFLYMMGQPASVRNVQERFQHSGETVSRQFHSVLESIWKLSRDIIKPIDLNFTDVPEYIKNDKRYWPYFKDCIGAIDGTHICIRVPPSKQIDFIGRKWYTSTNVMAVCVFDMCFTFVWAGLEGKYYLVDAGYPTFKGFMGPYKDTRYHLPQFQLTPKFRSKNEVFNYHHSSLRTVIERTFGVCKARWKVLQNMPTFCLDTQFKIIVACFALHNFIRRYDAARDILEQLENIDDLQEIEQDGENVYVHDRGTRWLTRKYYGNERIER
ncbi:uncharacterized protein LOC142523944 [Primulina tabacum]|uniref:uncharacterized protein LOC142523944 n=1 Tax=Primulina tabacum TaxID=48773 RepID=UPI003F5ACEFD